MKKKTPKTRSRMPQRPQSHITGDEAVLELKRTLPGAWIVREVQPDYGIDCEIEVVNATHEVTGALVLAQMKGKEQIDSKARRTIQVKTSTVRYWLALPVPVILVRVTQNPAIVLWLDVREHLHATERFDTVYTTRQKTMTFDFSQAAALPASVQELEKLAFAHRDAVVQMRSADLGQMVADVSGYHIFLKVFDGDVERWRKWLREKGSDHQIMHDYPFVVWLKSQLHEDKSLLDRIRVMITEFDTTRGSRK